MPLKLPLTSPYKEQKRDRRRDQVMAAAAAVFAEKGYHEATTKDIADRLGILPGSLYYYIDSKEAALVEVCRRHGAVFNENLQALLERDLPLADKVRAGIALHLMNNRLDLVYSFAFSRRTLPDAVLPELTALSREYQRLWEAIFRRAVEAGELPRDFDVPVATMALLALCNGAIDWYEKKPAREIARIAEKFAGYFLDGILGQRS
ncbi:MAG: TetR/AcrR family transcriptional regulator [Candidatus Eiseniibacteriota bacterium]